MGKSGESHVDIPCNNNMKELPTYLHRRFPIIFPIFFFIVMTDTTVPGLGDTVEGSCQYVYFSFFLSGT